MSLNYFTKAYTTLKKGEHVIALTFDDGPSAAHTPAVLEVLDRFGAKATFFCIGREMDQHPELVKQIRQRGHQIGNHSYTHSNLFSVWGTARVAEEIARTNGLIKALTGEECRIFRPPYGVTNPPIAAAAQKLEMKVIGWNIRSYDTASKNPEQVIRRVLDQLKPGSVILLHDNLPNTPQILEAILQKAQAQQYQYKLARDLIYEA